MDLYVRGKNYLISILKMITLRVPNNKCAILNDKIDGYRTKDRQQVHVVRGEKIRDFPADIEREKTTQRQFHVLFTGTFNRKMKFVIFSF